MTRELKILDVYYEAKRRGDKPFEIRDNTDRGFQKGDEVIYTCVDELGIFDICRPKLKSTITFVIGGFGVKDGYVVFGEKDIREVEA